MTIWRCPRCRRAGEPDDARPHWHRGDRDEPGYWEDACCICAPSEDDITRAREAEADRQFSLMRESHGADATGEP